MADGIGLRFIFCSVIPEHLPDTCHIRTVPAKKSRRLKGSDARLRHKIIGIYHDTRIHAIGFLRTQAQRITGILQDLRYHLTG